jgi:hypothetical protein
LQIGTSSASSIGREASEMSVSPTQNFSKPPPVPEVPTVTWTSGFSCWKSSAAASLNGATVLEPSIRIAPERPEGVSPPLLAVASPPLSSSPQAATPKASAIPAAKTGSPFLEITGWSPSEWISIGYDHHGRSGSPQTCYHPVADL